MSNISFYLGVVTFQKEFYSILRLPFNFHRSGISLKVEKKITGVVFARNCRSRVTPEKKVFFPKKMFLLNRFFRT